MSKTVLLVDDEERLVSLVKTYLMQEGFHVVTARNGREALFLARQEKPDLILLDLMMPEMDGYEFMRLHRKERETPIILLTARVEDSDKVLGLELGADDYVTKPFSPRELTARVRAVLRRAGQAAPEPDLLRAADVTLDRAGHTVRVGERMADLTPPPAAGPPLRRGARRRGGDEQSKNKKKPAPQKPTPTRPNRVTLKRSTAW